MSKASGLLLIDKPAGLTSAAVVAKIKSRFRFDKIGHSGTLDPFATGLMVILVNEGTKIARFLLEGQKAYTAHVSIGTETDSGDLTGKVSATSTVAPDTSIWEAHRSGFVGKIFQTPPRFSALKKDGVRHYERARAGEEFTPDAREVEVFTLKILEHSHPQLAFHLRCGGGTYVRSLASDWAKACGTLAHLTSLRRTETLGFSLEQAHTLESILASDLKDLSWLPLTEALKGLPILSGDVTAAGKLRQGLLPRELNPRGTGQLFQYRCEDDLVAILSYQQNAWKIERVFAKS